MAELFNLFATISLKDEGFTGGLNNALEALGKINNVANDAIGFIAKGIAVAGTAISGFGLKSIQTGMDFEAQMSRVGAIAGAVGDDLGNLTKQAVDLGAATSFSAKEAAIGMENLASAGFSTNEIMAAMPGLLDLAASSGEDLGLSSQIAASTLRGFALDASDAGHVADVLAKAAADTNAGVATLGDAMKYIAPVANAMGISMEESAAAIGIMSDAGIIGSQAGTTLRAALSRIVKPSKEMNGVMAEMGVSFFDAQGKMLPLEGIIAQLQTGTEGWTDAQKNNAMATLFGQEALSGMLALVDAGPEKLNALTTSLENSDGAAQAMATTMLDNLKGSLEGLSGTLESIQISLYQNLQEPLNDAVGVANDALDRLLSALNAGGISGAVAEIGNVLADLVNYFVGLAPQFIQAGVDMISSLIEGLTANSDSIMTAGMNAFNTLLDGIRTILPQLVPLAVELITSFISGFLSYTEMIYTTGISVVTQLLQGIADNLPMLISQAQEAITNIMNGLQRNLPLLLQAGMDILAQLITGIAQSLPTLIPAAIDIIMSLLDAFIVNAPLLLDAGLQLILGLVDGLLNALPTLTERLPELINGIISALLVMIPQIVEAGIQLLSALVENLPAIIQAVVTVLPELITGIVNGLATMTPMLVEAGVKLFIALVENAPAIIMGIVQAIPQIIQGIITAFTQVIPQMMQIGVQVFSALVQDLPSIIGALNTAILSIRTSIINFFQDFPAQMSKVGGDIIAGLGQGITQAGTAAIEAIKSLGTMVINAIKGIFGIASPSTVFAEIGNNIIAGLGQGISAAVSGVITTLTTFANNAVEAVRAGLQAMKQKGTEAMNNLQSGVSSGGQAVVTAAQGIASNLLNAFSGIVGKMSSIGSNMMAGISSGIQAGAKNVIASAQNMASNALSSVKSLLKIQSPSGAFEDEVGKPIAQGIIEGINSSVSQVADTTKKLGTIILDGISKSVNVDTGKTAAQDFANSLTNVSADIIDKKSKKTVDAAAEMSKKTFANAKLWIEQYRQKEDYEADQEIQMWQQLTSRYAEGTKERIEIDKNINKLSDQMLKERNELYKQEFENNKEWVKLRKENNMMSMQEEIDFWMQTSQQYFEGSDMRKQADQELMDAQQRLFAEQEKITGQMADAEQKYQDAIDSRSKSIANSFGLFEELKAKEKVSTETLTTNLQAQVTEMENWAANLDSLAAKGIDQGLLDELRNMGPKANAEITALASMSAGELDNYVKLWGEKQALAREEAIKELAPLKDETDAKIKELTAMLNEKAGTDFVYAGQNTIDGFIKGIKSQFEPLKQAIDEMGQAAIDALQEKMQMHSPSRLFANMGINVGEGFIKGIDSMASAVQNTISGVFGNFASGDFSTQLSGMAGNIDTTNNSITNNPRIMIENFNPSINVPLEDINDVQKLTEVFKNFIFQQRVNLGVL